MKPGGTSRFIGFCAVLAAVSLLPGWWADNLKEGYRCIRFHREFPFVGIPA